MKLADLKATAFSLALIVNTFCLCYYMPGVWGIVVLVFLLVCFCICISDGD